MAAGIPALTGQRFVAAGTVFVAHALPKVVPFPQNQAEPALYTLIVSLSGQGMTLFFVLSGFVIHYNYAGQVQGQGARGLFNFFVARFARLYPLYLFCVTFELLLKYSYSQVPASLADVLPYYLTLTFSWFYIPFGDNALIYQLGLFLRWHGRSVQNGSFILYIHSSATGWCCSRVHATSCVQQL
jgi:peptidoglycan/LPS O-acetylase OafA/YrhL